MTPGASELPAAPDGDALAAAFEAFHARFASLFARSAPREQANNTIRLWDTASGRCLAVLLATPEGWVAFLPDGPRAGAFKLGGDIAGSFWHVLGLARFAPGELDEFLPDDRKLRLPDDYRFLPG